MAEAMSGSDQRERKTYGVAEGCALVISRPGHELHLLGADRNLHHVASFRCGCNPDAVNDGETWWYYHGPMGGEVDER